MIEKKIDTITAMLHAFIDGRLDKTARAKVESYFSKQPTRFEEFKEYRTVNQQLIHAYGISLDIVVPERFNTLIDHYDMPKRRNISATDNYSDKKDIEHTRESPRRPASLWRYVFPAPRIITNIAATCVLIFAGFMLGRYILTNTGVLPTAELAQIEQLAIDAHITYSAEKDHAVEVTAADIKILTKLLSKRLGEEAGPAMFEEFDFTLMGGSLLPSLGNHSAFYMYKNSSDSRLTYYIRRISTPTNNQSLSCKKAEQSLFVCRWTSETLVYVLVGGGEIGSIKELSMIASTLLDS